MTATMQPPPRVGEGLYSVTEAAHLLTQCDRAVPPAKIRRWLDTALSFGRRDLGDGDAGLSFHDLVSLELVARFRQRGASLQRVHRLEAQLQRQYPAMARPFAWRIFFTDGTSVWAGLDGDPSLVEIVGKRPDHYVWTGAIASFATEVDYAASGEAKVWRRAKGVELDPTRQQGQPVVAGTRVPVSTVIGGLAVGSASEVADWYGLSAEQVADAAAFGRS